VASTSAPSSRYPHNQGPHSSITLDATDTTSALSIRTRGRAETTVGDIVINGSLGTLSARTTDLLGDLTASGTVRRLWLDDVADAHQITIGPAQNTRDTLTARFDRVQDLALISGTPMQPRWLLHLGP